MRPWGRILAASSLVPLAACSQQPAADWPRAEGERPPPKVPELIQPSQPSNIGPLVPLERIDETRAVAPQVLSARSQRFAMVVLAYPPTSCPIAPTSCQLMGQKRETAANAHLDPTAPGHGIFSDFVAAPERWSGLSSGKDVVYGVRADTLDVDAISADGTTKRVAHVDEEPLRKAKVVELSDGLAVVGEDPRSGRLRAIRFDKDGAKASDVPLGVAVIQPRRGRMSAQAARTAGAGAIWPPFDVVPTLDANGAPTRGFSIVAVAVEAPPPGRPSGKSWKGAPPKGKAKNGCGGPASRRLSDASVKKELLVLRSDGDKVVDKQVLPWSETADQDAHPFAVVPRPGGELQVDEVRIATDGSTRADQPLEKPWAPVVNMPPVKETMDVVTLAGFDPGSGEALVCVHGKKTRAIVATEKTEVRARVEVESCEHAARTSKGWLLGGPQGLFLLAEGSVSRIPLEHAVQGILRTDRGVVVVAQPSNEEVRSFVFDESTGRLGAPKTGVAGRNGWDVAVIPWKGSFALVEHGHAQLTVVPDGGEPVSLSTKQMMRHVVPVFGDTVVLSDEDGVAKATWLSSKEERAVGRVAARYAFASRDRWETVLIPDKPGLGPIDAGRLTRERCSEGVPLAEGERLYACIEGRSLVTDDLWVGLRRISWKPAAK